ncbi:uncharacterized protein LOC119892736 isoform X2 [Micropterus salmoides]|uniref:uncharacterized protein LOC119892736 isoform X2 n=1 Tax=Micropterus salmoides TaxID=27706 RepID=UPI0018EC0317|nr:uncharacterized protein LOC119892736 isoform X2 [Micropterus salmoides]
MGTQGPGRKRIPNRERLTAEDDALNQVAREMSDDEERMSVGSRGSFRVEERPDRDFLDKGSRTASTLSAATLASLGGASSRRGSCDTSFSVETEASIRDMKDSLAESEEKYRKAMVSNAQLHNEKSTLMYQVETLREELSDMEELLWESRRQCDDRTKELERERQAHGVLQFQFKEMKETLRQTEELLTAHGVVVSPEVSTNGETGQDGAEDDVSAESVAQLAQDASHGGRESMLGTVREQQPAEGSKQDDMKSPRCQIYKRSQLLKVISTSDQTKPDASKPVKGLDKQARERRDRAEKLPGRNEGAREVQRNKGSGKEPTKKYQIGQRQDGGLLFRNEQGRAAQMSEPKSAIAQLIVNDQAFKGRTKLHRGSGVKSSVASNRDVLVTEVEHSLDDQICKIQTNLGGTQLLVHGSESQEKGAYLVSPVRKSRLVPPRPAKDIILENKAIVLSVVTAGKQNQDVASVTGNETSDIARKRPSAGDIFLTQESDGNACRDVSFSDGEEVPHIPALKAKETPTSVESLKEGCDGHSFKDEDIKLLTDLVENDTFQSFVHKQQTENLGSALNKEKALKNEGDLSCSDVPEGPSFETKMKPSELDALLPAEEAIIKEELGTSEKLEDCRLYKEEPIREAFQIRGNSSEFPKCDDQTETPRSSTLSPLAPVEMSKDWSGLEKMIQSILKGFVENQGFAAEIPRILPDVSGFLRRWISDLEGKLKNVAENEQRHAVIQESAGQMTGIKPSVEGELLLKDLAEGNKSPEVQSPVGYSVIIKGSSLSRMLEVASLEVHPQAYDVSEDSSQVCEDVQDLTAVDDQEATENTSEVVSNIRIFNVEVTESSPQVNCVDIEEERQSQSDPMVTSCFEEFVFVESAKSKNMESDWGLVDSATNQVVEVVPLTNKQREMVCRSRSCLDPVVETPHERSRTLSTNSQSSKVRRLSEITADEFKPTAVPELVLMSRQEEGRITEDVEELSVGDMDSCEEVDEWEAQQTTQQQHQAETQGVQDVNGSPVASSEKHLSGRKDKHKTDCRIL